MLFAFFRLSAHEQNGSALCCQYEFACLQYLALRQSMHLFLSLASTWHPHSASSRSKDPVSCTFAKLPTSSGRPHLADLYYAVLQPLRNPINLKYCMEKRGHVARDVRSLFESSLRRSSEHKHRRGLPQLYLELL